MKQYIGLFLIAALAISCNSQKNSLDELNVKGKVWKIQETSFYGEEKFGKYQIGSRSYYGNNLSVFNEDGYIMEYHSLDKNGKTEELTKYTYNKENQCTEIDTYKESELKRKIVNNYKDNKIKEVNVFSKNGVLDDVYIYEYNGKLLSGGKILDSERNLVNTFENEYKKDLLTSQTVKGIKGEIIRKVEYKRNSTNNVIESKTSYPKDSSEDKYTFDYEYDKKGNWIKQYQFNKEGKIEHIVIRNIVLYDDINKLKSDNDFMGVWFVVDENDWIEFRKENKYDSGYKDKISESGSWEIDAKQQILTFRANTPDDSRKYKYEFEGSQMVLFTIQGDEKMRLEKR